MDLAVFGASGPTGRLVVRFALDAGHRVVAATRDPDRFPMTAPGLEVRAADVADAAAVDRVVAGTDAVVSTYGVPYSRRPVTVYSEGITHVTRAMAAHGLRRLVCVSSTTLATTPQPGESLVWRRVIGPLLRHRIGRTLYDDMERMERIVRDTDLDWTVVRPAGLFDATSPTRDYQVSVDRLPGHVTSRADLAETLVREATGPGHPRSVVEVLTRSGTPGFLDFVKEASGRR